MISKELLSEVMKKEVKYVESNLCYFEEFSSCMQGITFKGTSHREYWNIYELAHKCKEWALSQGFSLSSSKPIVANDEGNQVFNYWWCAYLHEINKESFEAPLMVTFNNFNSETEPEAIFKACQWILENKN